MEKLKIDKLSFTYPQRSIPALRDITLSISDGELFVLFGKSGCGKSTLLSLLKPPSAPHGTKSGGIFIDEIDINDLSPRSQAEKIGYVGQVPDNQIVCDKVWHELAFGLESLGMDNAEIRARVAETAAFFGIENWFYRSVNELSGGQKQLLNLAAVMVMQPSVLILDEPTSRLDPIAASELLRAVEKINKELGVTVIMSEHRLEEAFDIADRAALIDKGELKTVGTPSQVGQYLKACGSDMMCAMPTPMRVFYSVGNGVTCPITVRDGRRWLKAQDLADCTAARQTPVTARDTVLEFKDVYFKYEKEAEDVIKGMSFKLHKGEIYAICGGNGVGKTTAISVAAGLKAPYRGKVICDRAERIVMIPQEPRYMFSHKTVIQDLKSALDKTAAANNDDFMNQIIKLCEAEDILLSHPYDLSGGELQRAAMAAALLKKPKVLILDEPTKGMDAVFKRKLGGLLAKLAKEDKVSIILVSHDIEFCAEFADRVGLMFDGQISAEGGAAEFFRGKSYYTTAANRMSRGIIKDAVLCGDILRALGKGEDAAAPADDDAAYICRISAKPEAADSHDPSPKRVIKASAVPRMGEKSQKTIFALLATLVCTVLTVLAGLYLLDDRKYYFISILIIFEALLSSALMFEGRRPKAREITVLSVLCAAAVVGRAAFAPLPQFKPTAAIVIISAICFGGQSGFLVGAVSAFVSNFIFGQGPWTPWQMFAMGAVGLAAGVILGSGAVKKTRTSVAVTGFLLVLAVYGGIMNPASVLMMQPKPTAELITAAYVSGLPFDIVHALSTALFLWFGAQPMCDKIERVKIKYGFYQ